MTGQICTNHYTDSHLPHQQIEAKASKHTIFKSKEASVIRLCNNRSIRKWIHSAAGTCQANTFFSHTSVEENGHPLSRLSWFKMYKVHAHQCVPQVLISHTCRQALLPGCGFWTADWPVLVPGRQSSQPKMIRCEEADLPCKWVTTGVTAFSTNWVMLKKVHNILLTFLRQTSDHIQHTDSYITSSRGVQIWKQWLADTQSKQNATQCIGLGN